MSATRLAALALGLVVTGLAAVGLVAAFGPGGGTTGSGTTGGGTTGRGTTGRGIDAAAAGSAPSNDVLVLVTGTSTELRPRLPQAAVDLLLHNALAAGGSGSGSGSDAGSGAGTDAEDPPRAVVLGVDADRTQTERAFDLTPRRGDGADAPLEHVSRYRERLAAENVAAVGDAVAAVTAHADGHSLLLALQAADERAETAIVVVSSGIDTVAPLDLRTAGFDFPREAYVEHLRATGELPNLSGKSVLIALTPPAGEQPALNLSTRRQLEGMWTAVIAATGAHVEVVPAAGQDPPQATNRVPPVPVPQVRSPVRDAAANTTVFVLPAAVLFQANTADLLDPQAARAELGDVVAAARAGEQTVSVVGHTAVDRAGPDGGGPLSAQRAAVVRDLLVGLGVPIEKIVDVRGVGAREPLVDPPTSPANRTVVVTLTRAG